MAIWLSALLISTFTLTGLLALWAATSPRHWFVRTATVLAVAALPLAIPAPEAVGFIGVQAAVVAAGAWSWRRLQARGRESAAADIEDRRSRFSIALIDLLLLLATAAAVIAAARGAYLAQEEPADWRGIASLGIGFGVTTLLATFLSIRRRRWYWFVAALPVLFGLAAGMHYFEPGFVSWVLTFAAEDYFADSEAMSVAHWGAILTAALLLLGACIATWRLAWQGLGPRRIAVAARAFLAGALLLLAALPGWVFYRMLTPLPLPAAVQPVGNDFADLMEAGEQFDVRAINLSDEMELPQFEPTVASLAAAYAVADRVLDGPCSVPLTYTVADINVDWFGAGRNLARAYRARARVHLSHSRPEDAAKDFARILRLGGLLREGGFLVHYLVGVAIEGTGVHAIWDARNHLDASSRTYLSNVLWESLVGSEDLERMLYRERVWCERAYMPYNRLSIVLCDLMGKTSFDYMVRDKVKPRRDAELSLILCELAIAQFRKTHDRLPTSLDELAPDILPAVPIDPFDSTGGPLRYRSSGDGYILYSVGPNRVDDGGKAVPDEESPGIPRDGDFRLDALWTR